ncbi:MAG: hypothetical protein H6945_07755 [Zoogloeaceae bacterium]|nr:hypothetical protein [Zoogloeaceae bacterium]
MENLVAVVSCVLDLLQGMNPFRLAHRDYRERFWSEWREVGAVAWLGFVLGVFGVLVPIAVLTLAVWAPFAG